VKRIGGLFESIASFENLYRAYLRSRRGKKDRASIDRFGFDLEPELLRLRRELLEGTYHPGEFVTFTIHDPKTREIAAAPFRDRVLHQAILGVLEPHLDRTLDADSYACRKGLGMDAALRRARALTRRAHWVLKSDIQSCFPSVDHAVLKACLTRRFKDRRLLALLEKIIDHGGTGGKGIPIGSLTSQWFAGIVLDVLDRHVRHTLKPRGYLRYMDDFALLDDDRERLKDTRQELARWLVEVLELKLKPKATQIFRAASGWPFLGFRIQPRGLRIRRENWRRFQKRMGAVYHRYERGEVSLADLVRSVECRIAHMNRAATRGLRRKEMKGSEL
jgi:retron-type reverse transcriptase